jgi:hypothetical protein
MENSEIDFDKIVNLTNNKEAETFYVRNLGLLNYTTNIIAAQGHRLLIRKEKLTEIVYLEEWDKNYGKS